MIKKGFNFFAITLFLAGVLMWIGKTAKAGSLMEIAFGLIVFSVISYIVCLAKK